MHGRINYEEELRKANEKLAELRKQKEEMARESSLPVQSQMPTAANLIMAQVEQLKRIAESQTNMSPAIHQNTYSQLRKGLIVSTAFDEYELVKQIGEGGCGRVFSAKNPDDDFFAIKFVDKQIGREKLKRFKNEIFFCEHASNANIVKVVDHGVLLIGNEKYVFCVMPLYTQSLRAKMRAGLRHDKVVEIFLGLLKGLQYAHNKNVIHRDIKPENIMFEKDSDVPVICDFGIAHFSAEDMETLVVTKPTDRLANFQYSAPEQREKGGVAVPQTDIFALGLLLNEMFTGIVPQGLGYKTIREVAPKYDYLDDLFSKMYRQNPNDRLYPEQKILTELEVLKRQSEPTKGFTN